MMPSHRSYARIAFHALLVLSPSLSPGLAAQSFEGVITINSNVGGMKPAVQVISVKGKRWRLDGDMGGGPGERGTILADGEGHVTTLIAARKMWVRPPMLQERGDDAMADYSFTPTGKKDHVLEYDCEYYQVHNASSPKQRSEWCITSALGHLGYSPMGGSSNGESIRKSFPKGFFALKAVDEKGKVDYEVVKVERKRLDDAVFVPPPDYTEMKVPGMPGMPGRKRP